MAVGAIGKGSFKGFEQSKEDQSDVGLEGQTTDQIISRNLQNISRNIQQLKKSVDSLGTSRDSKDLRQKLKTTQNETNQLTKQTSNLIRRLEDERPEDKGKLTQWKVQKQRFGEKFHDLLKDYQELQKQIKSRERADIRESLQKSGFFDIDVDESGSLVKDGEQIEIQALQATVDLDLIKQREQDLKQLEQDIVDINEIFKQLGTMIHEQGEVLDHVEANVETAQENVQQALEDIKQASSNVNESRRKKLMCILLVVFLCLIAVVIIAVIATQA